MEIKEEIIKGIETEIEGLFPSILDNKDNLDRLQKLMSIYASLTAIRLNNAQIESLKYSQEIMKNTDFSKLDLNELLNTLRRDG